MKKSSNLAGTSERGVIFDNLTGILLPEPTPSYTGGIREQVDKTQMPAKEVSNACTKGQHISFLQ
jgi:hypothetical protein